MRVLVSAYACEPGEGSEPGAGWAWVRAAALRHETWLLTRANNRDAIEAALAAEPELQLHPIYLDLSSRALRLKRGSRGVHLYYLLWQRRCRRVASELHEKHRFDVAHHVTFAVDWMPSAVIGLPELPSIWGPVGGAAPFPKPLLRYLGWRGALTAAIRHLGTRFARLTIARSTARGATVILAQNQSVADEFHWRTDVLVETNVALSDPVGLTEARRRGARTALFVGRLVPWKGVALALAAIARPELSGWELLVLGDGPDRPRLERIAQRLGVADRVVFEGRVERARVAEAINESSVLLYPSLHDAASWAVGEALVGGLPVVCLAVAGPLTLTRRAQGGVAVPPDRQAVRALASATLEATRAGSVDGLLQDRLPVLLTELYEASRAAVLRPDR